MIGQSIKGFDIVAHLGRGGMGEVWAAQQPLINTRVAIKLLSVDASADASQVERFFHEAVAASKIKHAGIVRIHDVGFHDGRAFLIMELLEGETLATRVRRQGALPVAEVIEIGRQLGSVLAATHAAGIVHRDLKPDNVFLVPDLELASRERAKVLDFGIAKLAGRQLAKTAEGGSMGTPPYMAPEQWTDASSAGSRADVYSLGCLLFEIACGRPPFVTSSVGEACTKHLTETPPLARTFAPDLPAELEELIACMLLKPVDERPTMQAVTTVLARLGGVTTQPPIATSPIATDRTLPATAPATDRQSRPPLHTTRDGTFDKASASLPGAPKSRSPWLVIVPIVVSVVGVVGVLYAMGDDPDAPAAALVEPKLGLDALAQFHDPTPRNVGNLRSASMWTAARDDFADACKQPAAPKRWCAAREFADGQLAMTRHDAKAAVAAYEKALATDADWPDAHVALESALAYQHDVDGALAAALHAQRLDPKWWVAVAAGARAHAAGHHNDDMIQEYRRALSLAPNNAVLLAEVALAYHSVGEDAEADKYGDAALAVDDSLVAVHLMRAERRLEKHDGKAALAEADKVVAVQPTNGAAHLARGDALALLGDKPGAFAEYKKASDLASANTPDQRLADVRAAMNHDVLPAPRGAPSSTPEGAVTGGADIGGQTNGQTIGRANTNGNGNGIGRTNTNTGGRPGRASPIDNGSDDPAHVLETLTNGDPNSLGGGGLGRSSPSGTGGMGGIGGPRGPSTGERSGTNGSGGRTSTNGSGGRSNTNGGSNAPARTRPGCEPSDPMCSGN